MDNTRKESKMGHGCRGLQHGAGVGRSMGGLPPFHVALTWGGRTLRSGVSASWSQPSYCGGCGASSGAGGAADARRAPVRIVR